MLNNSWPGAVRIGYRPLGQGGKAKQRNLSVVQKKNIEAWDAWAKLKLYRTCISNPKICLINLREGDY